MSVETREMAYQARLQKQYRESVMPKLKERLGLANDMQVPAGGEIGSAALVE